MKVGIIGCGLVGQKRAAALKDAEVVACADIVKERAESLARAIPAHPQVMTRWQDLIDRPDVDVVIVATPRSLLAEIVLAAVCAGKHALVEKPAARPPEE